jgi:hypothetical protein
MRWGADAPDHGRPPRTERDVDDRGPDAITIFPLRVPQGRGPARRLAGREIIPRPGQEPRHRRPRRGSVAAGHASPSGKERKRLPTTRDPRGSIEAMSTVANGHPPTDRTRAGRRKGDRAWGDVGSRPERRPLPPSGRKEDRRRSRPGSDVEKPLVPARSRRRHPVTDAPLFARRGRRSFRNRSAAQDAHADQTMEIRRVV